MASTIADNDYVIVDKGMVISVFKGSELPAYNEDMTTVIDVTALSVKPQMSWTYDAAAETFTEPMVTPVAVISPVDILKEELKETVIGDITYMGNVFQAGPAAPQIINSYLAMIALDGALPAGFFWLDKSNNKVFMTEAEFKGFASAVFNNYWSSFSQYVEQRQLL
jgi:hypothetical protein